MSARGRLVSCYSNGKCSWCMDSCPLFGRYLLLGMSIIREVHCKQNKSCCVALPHVEDCLMYRLDLSSYHRSGNLAAVLVRTSKVPTGCLEERSTA